MATKSCLGPAVAELARANSSRRESRDQEEGPNEGVRQNGQGGPATSREVAGNLPPNWHRAPFPRGDGANGGF